MRWIIRIAATLLLLVVVAIVALFLLPADRIASIAEDRFEAATGRSMTISGDVSPSLIPTLGVTAEGITIANADWSSRGPMLTAETLSVAVDWSALWGGEIRVRGATIGGADVVLEVGPDGSGNWVMGRASGDAVPAPPEGDTTAAFALDSVTLTDSSLRFYGADGSETALTDIDADLSLPAFTGPLAASLSARMNGQSIDLRAEIDRFADYLAAKDTGLTVDFSAGSASMSFGGLAGLHPVTLTGDISATLDGTGDIARALNIPPPDLPRGLGQDQIAATGQLSFIEDTVTLRGLDLKLDQNVLTGALDVTLGGARPFVAGQLSGGALDLTALGGDDDGGAATDGSTGWSTEPIDASGLGALDADVTFSAASIAIGNSQLGRTSLTTKIDNARAATTINELYAYDGQVNGSFVVNARKGLSVRADLDGSAIAISRLFSELFDYDRLISIGDMTLSVLGSGASQHAIINSLDGEGTFEFGAGELLGWDLEGMLRTLDLSAFKTGSRTIFDSITGTFRIVDGVVINENLTFLSPLIEARGSGEVGLGGQTINYRITPRLLSGERAGLSVPLVITGTWDAPKFRLDLQALAEQELGEEIEAIKESAKSKVKEKVTKELGGSTEDEIKKKLEEKAVGGLLKLFE